MLSYGSDKELTAVIIDSQRVKTTETVGPCGFDAGKKIKGRKRHIVPDTQGHILTGVLHEAKIQHSDGAHGVMRLARVTFSYIVDIFIYGSYTGKKLDEALTNFDGSTIEIIERPHRSKSFALVARRCVVERILA